MLSVITGTMASQVRVPELALTTEESGQIKDALALVAAEYDLTISSKATAWMTLAGVTGGIAWAHVNQYGERLMREPEKPKPAVAPTFAGSGPYPGGPR